MPTAWTYRAVTDPHTAALVQRPCSLAATTGIAAASCCSSFRIYTSAGQEFCLESWNDVEEWNSQPHHDLRNAFSKRQR